MITDTEYNKYYINISIQPDDEDGTLPTTWSIWIDGERISSEPTSSKAVEKALLIVRERLGE